ncbi:MAG TPA: XRE family transcriptional regulator [Longimicrobiales bacterium]
MTREQIAARLREARESIGFTQAEVARELGVHRPTISEIEAGRRAVTSEELYRLAQLYGTSVGALLTEGPPPEEDVERILFRRQGLLDTPRARTAIRRFMQHCRAERELEELLGLEPPPDARPGYTIRTPGSVMEAVAHGEEVAEEERRRLGLGAEPIRNPLDLLDRQGVRIAALHGLEDIELDGVYFEAAQLGACIGINLECDHWTGFRPAFTAAHEYAHWLLRDVRAEEFSLTRSGSDVIEVRANAFAAALLMPRSGVLEYFGQVGLLRNDRVRPLAPADIVRAMDHFGVSRPALAFRLQNLGLIDGAESERLRSLEFSPVNVAKKLGLRLRRDNNVGARFGSLVTEAWRRGLITTGRAADLLGLDVDSYRSRMWATGVELESTEDVPLLGAAGAG